MMEPHTEVEWWKKAMYERIRNMRTQSNLFGRQFLFNPRQKAQIHAAVCHAIAAELGIEESQVTPELIMAAFNGNKQQLPKSYGLTPDQQFRIQCIQEGNFLPHPASIASQDGAIVAFGNTITAIKAAMAETYGDRQPLGLTTITSVEDKKNATFVSCVEGLPHLAVTSNDLVANVEKPVSRDSAMNGSKTAMGELITQLLGMSGGYYHDPKLGDYDVKPFPVFNNVGELSCIEVFTPYNPLAWMENDCGIDQSCVAILNGNLGTSAAIQRSLEKLGYKVPHATKKQPTPFTDCQTPAGFQPTSNGTPVKTNQYGQYEKALFSVKVELVKDENKATIRFTTEYHGYRGVAIYVLGQLLSPRYAWKQLKAVSSLLQWVHLAVCQFKQEIFEEIGRALQFDPEEVVQDGTVRFISNVSLNNLNLGIFKVNVTDPQAYTRRVASQLADQNALRFALGRIVAIGRTSLPLEIEQLAGFEIANEQPDQPVGIA